jgi:protein involved in ribonucleotide reduction
LITGRAVTGILHFINGTPAEWYSKRQGTVETATYGSEFVAARIATDQVIDYRTTLRYLGVNVATKTYLFGDNQSVITSSTIPHSLLNKRHNALSYHRVREAIAAGILRFIHISGKLNPADVLSKHCGFPQLMPLIRPILFWRGEATRTEEDVPTLRGIGECHGSIAGTQDENSSAGSPSTDPPGSARPVRTPYRKVPR